MILEMVVLNLRPGSSDEFERAFERAQSIISSMPGYLSHELHKCIETSDRYLLLVYWQKIEDHTEGFRQSAAYLKWKAELHHFYQPFPDVEHFMKVLPERHQ